jgi:hypothetical protein
VGESLTNLFLALLGRVKGVHGEYSCYLIPVVTLTETGLKLRLWVGRMIKAYQLKGITSGWVFRNESRSPGLQSYYEPYFFSVVQDIHERGVCDAILLDPEDDAPARYELSLSLQCGYATHATHMGSGVADQNRLA